MTDLEIIKSLQAGENLTFGVHGRNLEVIDLMHRMKVAGLVKTEDASLS